MGVCDVCGNQYEQAFLVMMPGEPPRTFDSFECAIQELAPACAHCGVRVVGHGVEVDGAVFCGAHCARSAGQPGPIDRAETPPAQQPIDDGPPAGSRLDDTLAASFPASDPPGIWGIPGELRERT